MYKLFTVDNKKRSKIRGFWVDDKGKVYIDNIYIKQYSNRQGLNKGIKRLITSGEVCSFHKEGNRSIITDNKGIKSILNNRQVLKRSKLSIKEIKGLLSKYKGLTIYNYKGTKGFYFIEVFYN